MNFKFYLKELKVYILYKLKRPIPCAAKITITNRCNLKCYFCIVWKLGIPKNKKELSTEQIFRLIDECHKMGVPYVTITGGEPLLRADTEKIGFYLKKRGIISTLNTNGTLINSKRAKTLSKAYDVIRISLDGFGETHNKIRGINNAYEKTIKGLKCLINTEGRTAKIGLHFVITKYNYKELDIILELFKGKVDTLSVMPVYSKKVVECNPNVINNWKKAQKKLREYRLCEQTDEFLKNPSNKIGKEYCDAGKLYFAVSPYGNVWACSARPQVIMGNINKEPFCKIWKRRLDEKAREQIKNCPGCYVRCTTEMSMLFRKSPLELLKNLVSILRTYKY